MSEEMELPRGWSWSTTGEVCSSVRDGTHDTPKYVSDGIPLITSKNLKETDLDFTTALSISIEDHRKISIRSAVERGDVLFAMIGTIGNPVVVKTERVFSIKNVGLFKKNELALDPEYLNFWLSSWTFNKILEEKQLLKGTTQKFIPLGNLRILPLPLAPFNEQKRIVLAIEQQFSRLDAGVAALQRAKTKLKRYRAAVLKAAVEGKLTETWRAEHPTTEPASLLLERILDERRAKWEADLKAKGKDPAKVKYVELTKPDMENLPELPGGWCWATVEQIGKVNEQIVLTGPFGSNLGHEDFQASGVPVLTIGCLTEQGLSLEKAFYISDEKAEELERYRVRVGDLLFSRMASVGRADVVPHELEGSIINYHLMRLRLEERTISAIFFITFIRGSSQVVDYLKEINHGVTRDGINTSQLLVLPVALPPLTEQEQIVAEVERRLSIVDELEATVKANLKRAERLRQSILREAFAGRLVPQDPTDEPASMLLERIRNERKNGHNASNKTSNGRRVLRAPEPVTLDVTETEQAALWESIER